MLYLFMLVTTNLAVLDDLFQAYAQPNQNYPTYKRKIIYWIVQWVQSYKTFLT